MIQHSIKNGSWKPWWVQTLTGKTVMLICHNFSNPPPSSFYVNVLLKPLHSQSPLITWAVALSTRACEEEYFGFIVDTLPTYLIFNTNSAVISYRKFLDTKLGLVNGTKCRVVYFMRLPISTSHLSNPFYSHCL